MESTPHIEQRATEMTDYDKTIEVMALAYQKAVMQPVHG